MKKISYLICGLLLSILPCLSVSAMEEIFYTNQNGVEMTQDEYTHLLETYLDYEIAALTQEQFNFEISHKYTTIKSNEVYLQTDTKYDDLGNVEESIETVLTQEEYENGGKNVVKTRSYCNSYYPKGCWKTSHKKIEILYQGDGNFENPRVILTNTWKEMPSNRSYDVIGVRFTGTINYSYWQGFQTYVLNGKSTTDYVIGNDNLVWNNSGSMMAFQLPTNKSITALSEKFITYVEVKSGWVYGSYQHSRGEMPLSAATNVTFSSDGLGEVFKFNYNNPDKFWDNTRGVVIELYK